MASSSSSLPPEIQAAYRDAKARGLPDGWTCTIDKRKRRKWTAPTGKSCDSIPKALAISVELGMLPPDTKIISGKRKRTGPKGTTSRPAKKLAAEPKSSETASVVASVSSRKSVEAEDSDYDDEDILANPPTERTDPETTLFPGKHRHAAPTTVHWDPKGRDGRRIGWKVKIVLSPSNWVDGRITRYDPYTHKHKIEYVKNNRKQFSWIWIRNEEHNLHLATRMVWAHVKGYAWWPALVMEANEIKERREGYVTVEFFGTGEKATLRDSSDFIRPFDIDKIDPVVAKHKKKRNARAYQLACEEYQAIREARNAAAVFYAERAIEMVQEAGKKLVGKRIMVHRSDVNYPAGDSMVARVRAYSSAQKKWLLSYDISDKTNTKYEASWINLVSKKDCSGFEVLDRKESKPENEDLIPFLVGYEYSSESKQSADDEDPFVTLLKTRCRGCVEYWKKDDIQVACGECGAAYHLGCCDPPLTFDAYQKLLKDGVSYRCPRCVTCRGCYEKDSAFGSHPYVVPKTLSFPKGESLDLCHSCAQCYDNDCYCPNCAHVWDNEKYEKITREIEYDNALSRKRKGNASGLVDHTLPPTLGQFVGDDVLPIGAKIDPSCFYPETSEWGFGESDMLVCDGCDIWVHAGCSGLDEDEYDLTSEGKHPIYSKEFLCRVCCRERSKELVRMLQDADKKMLFAVPVTEKVAPNYHDVIKNPMDLRTMMEKAESEDYKNYTWVREDFELMVLNALTFNKYYTTIWHEAKRYYHNCLDRVFAARGKAAPPGKYEKDILAKFKLAEQERKNEEDRVQVDESVEKKDLVAGSDAASVSLPKLRDSPPDQSTCVPFTEVKLKKLDAFYCCWMECCFSCGSSGAMDTMLFCVDCGEAYHSFCANAPVHSMDEYAVAGWRCPNCKIDEISGDVPSDETRMLFCEMCDRGFSLDLLDPPLVSAPPGLWICGQCVDCKVCNNTAEPGGASLRHWSRDPEKCFRCGGCDGLIQKYMGNATCIVCTKFLRTSDDELARCAQCLGYVHSKCHISAKDFLLAVSLKSQTRGETEQNANTYLCPECSPSVDSASSDPETDLKCLSDHASSLICSADFPAHDNYSKEELHSKLMGAAQWEVLDTRREQFLSILREGLRLYSLAKLSFGDPRIVCQHALSGSGHGTSGLPLYLIQRSLRFVFLVRDSKLEAGEMPSGGIEGIFVAAKLAAAFLKVACAVLSAGVDPKLNDLAIFGQLLEPPGECGTITLAKDTMLPTKKQEEIARAIVQSVNQAKNEQRFVGVARIAGPLCGWADHSKATEGMEVWKDTRECCLCHLRGDDDAGILPNELSECDNSETRLGRLLPMLDGQFVHTGCALWSSEVWEAVDDGLIHAVYKAKSRGSQLKCFGCGFYGATVGCNKSNCVFNYHFPCAKACGAVFTADQHVFCANHKSSAIGILAKENFEHMKALLVAPEKKDPSEDVEADLCSRVGTLVVHSLGEIETKLDGFHSENYITPPGYVATRVFWSSVHPKKRTVYILKIERQSNDEAFFSLIPGDSPASKIVGKSVNQVYSSLIERVRRVNTDGFAHGNLLSKLPAVRKTRRKAYGLNGPQFFGFGLDHIRKLLESSPGVEAVVAPLTETSPRYRFCFVQPTLDSVKDLIRKRAAAKAERALLNSSGCARVEGMQAVARSGGSGRITRVLVRCAEEEGADTGPSKKSEEKARADRNLVQKKYKEMKAVPMEQRLAARRSHIHGWGLFTKVDLMKDDPIVEYLGELIHKPVADKRERAYEISGEGSCYMFRLDLHRIVDATMIGCMARFMNHSCSPNAYAKIIQVDTDGGQEKKIVVFANRDIAPGEEITYDYKFPVEDGSLRCTCGAPNCIGRLN